MKHVVGILGAIFGQLGRIKGTIWVLFLILALVGTSTWLLTPSGSTALSRETTDLGMRLGLDLQGGIHLLYEADLEGHDDPAGVVDGIISVMENRVNILGVSEPIIQKQGDNLILVQLAGITDIDEARQLIGSTALLEFRKYDHAAEEWVPAEGTVTVDGEEREEILNSRFFEANTYVALSQDPAHYGRPELVFSWNDTGAELSKQITGGMIGEPLGIFLGGEHLLGEDGEPIAPIVRAEIERDGVISGLSLNDARKLSNLLNAGRIPVALTPIFETTVSATLGADFVDRAILAGGIGIGMVVLFLGFFYRIPGLVASLALLFYVGLVLAIFKLIPVTLTLAGLAGFILSIGMAVDANVLIFERLKEELRAGRTLKAAMETGFNRAWSAIWVSNVSTIIITGILYWFGSSIVSSPQVMGFAVTLFIGVSASMFTAIVVTRTLLRLVVGSWMVRHISSFGVAVKNV